jgi:mono/diheme cytochrome c family protein
MKSSLEFKGTVLGILSALTAVGIAFGTGNAFRPAVSTTAGGNEALAIPPEGTLAHQGYALFMMNCAHCHGDDARGDEGPDLHGVTKSDARIASMIKNGVKGEMPKFGSKLNEDDVRALIAFVRTLRD